VGRSQLRTWIVGLAVAACAAVAAATALADAWDDVLKTCGTLPTQKAFAAFGDNDNYFMVPNGAFDSGATGWTLSGGAGVAGGVLQLPYNASATSLPVCVTADMPTIRFLVRTNGDPAARLRVEAVVKKPKDKLKTLLVATIPGTAVWTPTAPLPLKLKTLMAVSKQSPVAVAFKFTVTSGSWQVDKVFVDPLKECC
jgi:hypothetical protein